FKYSGGLDYSSGKYSDSETTTILYLPYRAGYKQGNFSGQIAVAWISIDGPGTVVGGGDGGVVLPSDGGESRRESGVGDTWVSLTYEIEQFPYEFGYLDVTGKLKIPTADEDKGLGTGEADLKLVLDYMYPLGRLTPMVTLACTKKGDPDGIDLRNVFYCSAGADWRHSKKISFGATLDFQQASVRGVDNPLDFFSYLSYKLSPTYSLTPYLYFGLSKGSPDVGGGLQVTFRP
ncbi:MAG: hypothetical protein KJN67_01270, partial [Pontiella sp.]|nr:hypothetical protein [Pontiella sp.]